MNRGIRRHESAVAKTATHMVSTHEREHEPEIEPAYDQLSLYVYEAGSDDLLEAVYDAETLAIPSVGDRLSFAAASADGDLEERTVSYREGASSPTYLVVRRDLTYLHVDADIEGVAESRTLVSEVSVWVTAALEEGEEATDGERTAPDLRSP